MARGGSKRRKPTAVAPSTTRPLPKVGERAAAPPPASENAPLWLRLLLPVVVAVAAFVTFLPALNADFVNWDDDKLFLNNQDYRGLGWSNLKWMFTKTKMGHWQPLSWITLGLDYKRYGMNARGYHLTNMLLHVGCAVVFYFLTRRLLTLSIRASSERNPSGNPQSAIRNSQFSVLVRIAAAFAALFFAVHPLRVESVAWVTERRDLLSGLFFILTISAYLRFCAAERARTVWYLAAIAIFILSILSKAWGMTIPAVLIVLDSCPLRRLKQAEWEWLWPALLRIWRWGRLWPLALLRLWALPPPRAQVRERSSAAAAWVLLEKVPFIFIAAFTAWKAIKAQTGQMLTVKSLEEHGWLPRSAQMIYGAAFYVYKTVLPFKLIPLYELPERLNPWQARFIIAAAAVFAALILLVLLRRRWPAGLALAVGYMAIYSPVSGIAQSGPQLVKDSYSYLCCLSWAVLLGGTWLWIHRRWGLTAFIGAGGLYAVWLGVLGVLSWHQTHIWQNSKTLWTHTLSIDDNCATAHGNLAIILKQEGQLDAAVEHYQRSLALRPKDADTHYNLGNCLKSLKRYDEAIECYKNAITYYRENTAEQAEHFQSHLNLGNTYRLLNRIPEAVEHHIQAARSRRDPELYELIANELRTVGRLEEAEPYFARALKLRPDSFDARYGLGTLLLQRGDCAQALEHLRAAVKLKPESEPAARALAKAQQPECGG